MRSVLVVLAFVVGACSNMADPSATSSEPQSVLTTSTVIGLAATGLVDLDPWPPFGATTVGFDGSELPVLVATSPEQRSQGLMNVSDMGGFAGMLFVFEGEVTSGFWMKETLIPLTVIYFGTDGQEISRAEMKPCVDGNSCPSYPPSGQYLYALEMPTGNDLIPLAPAKVDISLP